MAKKPKGSAKVPIKKNLVVIRGFSDWGEWLEEYATSRGLPVVVLLDQLAREAAKADGFRPAPKRY